MLALQSEYQVENVLQIMDNLVSCVLFQMRVVLTGRVLTERVLSICDLCISVRCTVHISSFMRCVTGLTDPVSVTSL